MNTFKNLCTSTERNKSTKSNFNLQKNAPHMEYTWEPKLHKDVEAKTDKLSIHLLKCLPAARSQ